MPFGTGKAVGDYLKEKTTTYKTYNFKIFEYLSVFWMAVNSFYALSEVQFKLELQNKFPLIANYISFSNQWKVFDEVRRNTSSIKTFRKRFYNWFNAFQALKIVHFLEGNYPKKHVLEQANLLAQKLGISLQNNSEELLEELRNWDKKNPL